MKLRLHSIFPFFLLCSLIVSPVIAAENSSDNPEDMVHEIINPQEEIQADPPQNCALPPEAIIGFIAGALEKGDVLRLLQQNLYLRTNRINVDPLIYTPALRPYFLDFCDWQFWLQPFYNQTSRVFLTKCSPFIRNYIQLGDSALANEISNILEDINEFGLLPEPIEIDIPQTLSLFQNIRLQERRVGLMFSVAKQYDIFNFSLRFPIYYMEHNFFLNNSEIDRIKNAPLFIVDSGENTGTAGEVEHFLRQTVVNDRVGLGDTRAMLLANIADNSSTSLWVGLQGLLPTAFDFDQGIIGGRFNPKDCIPQFDLAGIINLVTCDQSQKIPNVIETFTKAALRRLSTILINVPLGNEGHFGTGPYIDLKSYLTDHVSLHSTLCAEYYIPRKRYRFFLAPKNPADFQRNLEDESQAAENLAFINQQITNTLFPFALKVKVHPGAIFNINQELLFDNQVWRMGIGFDFLYQAKEKFKLSETELAFLVPDSVRKALKSSAYRGKIFSQIGFYRGSKRFCWHLHVITDATLFNRGVGGDFTVSITFGMDL